MTFLQKILKTSKNDALGINSAADGLRQLKVRLASEQAKLEAEKDRLRDVALDSADGEIDELPLLRQRARVKAFESAYEKALNEAGTGLNARTAEIDSTIADLEKQQIDLRVKRDLELLKLVGEFVAASGGRVINAPRLGHGGSIAIPATQALDLDEVSDQMKSMPAPGNPTPTKTLTQVAEVTAELQKLKMLRHLGAKNGLEALL